MRLLETLVAVSLWEVVVGTEDSLSFAEGLKDWGQRYLQDRTSWTNIRVHVAFNDTVVPESDLAQLKQTVLPAVTNWYQSVLKVPALPSNLRLSNRYCGQAVVPAVHTVPGVPADVVLYILTVPKKAQSGDFSAYGAPCLLSATVPRRVLAGSISLAMDYWKPLSLSTQIAALAHLFAHVFAFNSVLYPHFSKPDGSLYADFEVIQQATISGNTVFYMTLPSVVDRARKTFNCPTLIGVRLAERSEPDGYFLSHWSAKMMLNDFMADLITGDVTYSDVTMAVFQDSGWYEVQWDWTSPVVFGRHRGCSFFLSPCITSQQPNYSEFCVAGTDVCSPTAQGRGTCLVLTYQNGVPAAFRYIDLFHAGPQQLDYCPVASNTDSCIEETSGSSGEEKCGDCRCFAGTYYPTGGVASTKATHCHRVACSGGVAKVSIGGSWVTCPAAGGSVSIPGYTGTVKCPPASVTCVAAPCKNLCSGFGRCMSGRCVCDSGRTGVDCSQACHSSCLRCSALGVGNCLECKPGATLQSGECVCRAGLSMDAAGYCTLAAQCHITCKTCVDNTESGCTSCSLLGRLAGSTCVCPDGMTFDSNGVCVNCAEQCKKCSYQRTDVCLECFDTATLAATAPYCQCPSGVFDPLTRQCLSCTPLCTSCSGEPTNCTGCISGFQLSGSDCTCPAHSSNYISQSVCSPCHPQCVSCAGSRDVDCLSCADDAFLTSAPGRCLCRLPTSINCVPCMIGKECASCTSPAYDVCSGCYANAVLSPAANTCVCADGYFPNPDATYCSPCHPSCRTCFAAHYMACYSCPSYALQSGSQCLCTTSYYADADSKSCKMCADSHCLMCDKFTCYYCLYGFEFNDDEKCGLLPGFYFDENTRTTYACPKNCKECEVSGQQAPKCTSCLYATMSIDPQQNQCTCAPSTFFNQSTSKCTPCGHPKCTSCTSSTTCTSCASPYQVTSTANCACGQQQYEENGDCKPCHSSCATCIGPLESNCSACLSGEFLASGYCLCAGNSSNSTCKKCAAGCLTCSPASLDLCESCGTSATLTGGKCVCKTGYYPNPTALSCSLCSPACYSCVGGKHSQCTLCASGKAPVNGNCECPNGYGLRYDSCMYCSEACRSCETTNADKCTDCIEVARLQDGKCICLPGYAQVAASPLTCALCDMACATCTGVTAKECLSCSDGSAPIQSLCPCPLGFALSNNFCSPCHRTCKTCSAVAYNSCTACYSSGALEKGVCVCSPDRLSGSKCIKCLQYCQTCGENGTCVSCYSNASQSTTKCECNIGYFPSPDATSCQRCHSSCWSCTGPSATDCSACNSYAELTPAHTCECAGLTTLTKAGTCFLRTNLCADERCTMCRDPNAVNTPKWDAYNDLYGTCSCRSDSQFYILPSHLTPVPAALSPLYTFLDSFFYYFAAGDLPAYYEDKLSGQCQPCSHMCRGSCTQDPYDCWLCIPHAARLAVDLTKRCECVDGYYYDAGVAECVKCMENCRSCEDATHCVTCENGYELTTTPENAVCRCVHATCRCPYGTYLLRTSNTCETICPSGFTASNSECQPTSTTAFRFIFSTLTPVVSDQSQQFSMAAVESSACGGFSYSPTPAARLYQRGFWLKADQPQCITLVPDSTEFVFAPTHYVEAWVKASDVAVFRYAEDYYVSTEKSRVVYANGNIVAFLNDNFKSSKATSLQTSLQSTARWTLIRYELVTETPKGRISTRLRSLQDNKLLKEAVLDEYYFRDGPLEGEKAALKLTAYASGGAFVYEVTLGNRLWQAQTNAPCGCQTCTVQGNCLSPCAALEFSLSSNICSPCSSQCSQGCIRSADCEMTTDPLCTVSLTFDQCLACKPLSRLIDSRCSCVQHAVFNSTSNACQCVPPYQVYELSECRICANYLDNWEVAAIIDNDFLTLRVKFEGEIDVRENERCSAYFNETTFSKFGDTPTCIWDSSHKLLTLYLGAGASLMPEAIALNPLNLLKKNSPCTYRLTPLSPTAAFYGALPTPQVELLVPDTVSLSCTEKVVVSAMGSTGSKGRVMKFRWKLTHQTLGQVFSQYGNYSETFGLLVLPLQGLSPGELSIEVTALNGFGSSASAHATLTLTEEKALSVEIEGGGNVTVTTQTNATIAARVVESCGISDLPVFQWTYVGAVPPLIGTDPDPSRLTVAVEELKVTQKALSAGHVYTFLVSARQQSLVATATLTLKVQESPIIVRLNRQSGTHPNDENLQLDARDSFDPDNSTAVLGYMWTCQENALACTDSSNNLLLPPTPASSLQITTNRLRLGASYNFTATVFTDSKFSARTVLIEIVKTAGCFVLFPAALDTQGGRDYVAFVPAIKTNLVTRFAWMQTEGNSVTPDTPSTYPFLSFKPGVFEAGHAYTFLLTSFTFRGAVSSTISIPASRPPIGGLIDVQPTSGFALIDVFRISTGGWEDPEENYPLMFVYCVGKFCAGEKTLALWVKMKLPKGENSVRVKCVNALGVSDEAAKSISVAMSSGRHLADEALQDAYLSDTSDVSATCLTSMIYLQTVTPSPTLRTSILTKMEVFIAASDAVDKETADCAYAVIEGLVTAGGNLSVPYAARIAALTQSLSQKSMPASIDASHLAAILRISSWAIGDWRAGKQWLTEVVQRWSEGKLPDQLPLVASEPLAAVTAQRLNFGTLNVQAVRTVGPVSISFGNNWAAEPSQQGSTVVDLCIMAHRENSSAWVVETATWAVGRYYKYNFERFSTPSQLTLTGFNSSLNITFPRTDATPDDEVECWALLQGRWTRGHCSVVHSDEEYITVAASSLYGVTVQRKVANPPPITPTPLPVANAINGSDCGLNPAPLALSCSLLVIGALCIAVVAVRAARKKQDSEEPPETPQESPQEPVVSQDAVQKESENEPHEEPEVIVSEQRAELHDSLLTPPPSGTENPQPAGDSSVSAPNLSVEEPECGLEPATPQSASKSESVSTMSVYDKLLHKHLGLAVLLRSDLGWVLFSLFLVVLQIETFILGLIYNFWYDSGDSDHSAAAVFRSYSNSDFGYVCIAVFIGTALSLLLQIAFCVSGRQSKTKQIFIVCAALHLTLAAGVIALNIELCWVSAGLWAEGVLWSCLAQLVFVETTKALVWVMIDAVRLG